MSLGIKVMIDRLFGYNSDDPSVCYGKTITSAVLGEESITITFTDGWSLNLYDDGQSCCEHRYMTSDDKTADLVGATLRDITIQDAPPVDADEEHEVQFLRLITDRGEFCISNHNEHNGYYGGFSVIAKVSKPDAA